MMRRPSLLLLGVVLTFGSACATAGPAGTSSSARSVNTVTEEDLAGAAQLNLYDYLAAERPQWLRGSVPTRPGAASVLVFMEGSRLGGIQTLRTIATNTVRLVRYYDPAAAQQTFPGGDVGAVIQVLIK